MTLPTVVCLESPCVVLTTWGDSLSATTRRPSTSASPDAAEHRRDEVAEAVGRALRPFFSTLGEAFGIIEDRQLAMQQSIDDIRRRLDSGRVTVRTHARPPAPGSELALARVEALLGDIRDQLTLRDVFTHVEQPLPPPMEHLFNRLEDSQAMMEKLIGELAMRVGVDEQGNRRTPQPW